MWNTIFIHALSFANQAVEFGASLFLQSTILIALGLALFRLARSRGALVQTLILRLFLGAFFLSPAVGVIMENRGVHLLTIPLPRATISLPAPEPAPAPRIQSNAPARSLPAVPPVRENTTSPEKIALSPARDQAVPSQTVISRTKPLSPATDTRQPLHPGAGVRKPGPALPASSGPSPLRALLYLSFTALWGAASLFLLGRLVLHTIRILYLRRIAYPAAPRYIERCNSIAKELNVHPPAVLQSPLVQCPFLAGLFRPAIFLPLGVNEKECSSREVLFHELVHLAHHDTLWNLLHRVAVALFPFQPLLWVLSRMMEESDDYVCDDFVLSHRGDRNSYVLSLVNTAAAIQPARGANPLGVGFLSFPSTLRRRVERILDASRAITLRLSARLLVAASSLCLCLTFLTGLVGFRGASYAQIRKVTEFVEKSRMRIALAGAAITEQKEKTASSSGNPADTGTVSVPEETTEEASAVTAPASSIGQTAPASFTDLSAFATRSDVLAESVTTPDASGEHAAENTEHVQTGEPGPSPAPAPSSGKATVQTAATDSLSRTVLPPTLYGLSDRDTPGAVDPGPVRVSVPDNARVALKTSLEQGQENPVWSPAGKEIAFTGKSGRGIWKVPVNGGKPTLICDNTRNLPSGLDSETEISRTLCFSPDGCELTFVNYAPEDSVGASKRALTAAATPDPVIESVNITTGVRRVIAEGATDGCWSGDGRYFVYVGGDSQGIGILDILTGKRRQITETGTSPCLTPDGASIIYVDRSRAGMNDLYRVPLAGGTPEQLTSGERWWCPKISPDGEWVLSTGYGIPQNNQYTLFCAYNLQNRMGYYFTVKSPETVEVGTWSPSGRQFCYTRIAVKDGSTVHRSTIYIDNFQLSSLSVPAAETEQPKEFKLVGNFPNPFNPSTTIQFSLPTTGPAELVIYNMMGQKIRTLISGRMDAGTHSIVWNGRDQQNRPVSSGIYVARLKMEGKVETRRMTLVK